MSTHRTVVATRAGFHEARRIAPGTVFEVPIKMKGSWFKNHTPGAPIPAEAVKQPDPYTAQAPQANQGQTAPPVALSQVNPDVPGDVPLA